MARDSSYSLYASDASSASAVDFTTNPLSSTYTKLSFVVLHRKTGATSSHGLGFKFTGATNDILFRDNTKLQLYMDDGTQYGPAQSTVNTTQAVWQWKGFRFDGSATGAEMTSFLAGVAGTSIAGPASMGAMNTPNGFGYHGSASLPGWNGYLRDAFMWVGKALPDSAYEAIENGVHPLVFGPTHWWPMDNTLVDLVGGNNLTNMGANVSHSTAQSTPFISLPSGIIVPFRAAGGATAAVTGTATASITESDIVTGGKTIIVTLTGDTYKAAGTGPIGSTADTQAFIDAFSAATSPTNGWNNEVRDKALTSEIARTSDTVATWTIAAQSGYDISAQETIGPPTIPAAVLTSGTPIVSTDSFTIDAVSAGGYTNSLSLTGVG